MERGTTNVVATDDDQFGEHHVYRPHRVGLPRLRTYFRQLWQRREFALEMATSQMRAQHTNTALGQVWLVLNPLLLSLVYFVLIMILSRGSSSRGDLAHIMSGLFLWYYLMGTIRTGATSVTSGGKLILNMSFPKMLLPLSAAYQAFRRFLPTMAVYAVFHLAFARAVTPQLLLLPLVVLLAGLFALGLAMIMATLQVYYRDTTNFLPYLLRIWMYLSPVLWTTDHLRQILPTLGDLAYINPLYSVFGLWTDALNGQPLNPLNLGLGVAWSLTAFVVGAIVFISRERDFSVRL